MIINVIITNQCMHTADVLADRAGAQDRLRVSAVGHVGQGPRQQRRQEHVRDRAHLRGYHARDGQHCPGPCRYCRYRIVFFLLLNL